MDIQARGQAPSQLDSMSSHAETNASCKQRLHFEQQQVYNMLYIYQHIQAYTPKFKRCTALAIHLMWHAKLICNRPHITIQHKSEIRRMHFVTSIQGVYRWHLTLQ